MPGHAEVSLGGHLEMFLGCLWDVWAEVKRGGVFASCWAGFGKCFGSLSVGTSVIGQGNQQDSN